MSNIYEGKIWRTFPSSFKDPNFWFFASKTTDSNLSIIINLNWFQPFESSMYSIGVIYEVICNLLCDIRFKKENMLTLGLLSRPQEVKKHHINHFLASIVDELLELWNRYDLLTSNRFSDRKKIWLAVICCLNDSLVARKLCEHISVVTACYRCYKQASGNDGQRANFGGFDDMSSWFRMRDPDEYQRNAISWLYCQMKEEWKQHVLFTLVR